MKTKINIQDIAPNLDFIVGTASSDNLIFIHDYLREGTLEIDFDVYLPTVGKNLQRDYVWTDLQKSEYILTIFKGYGNSNSMSGMQPICIIRNEWFADNGVQKWQVVDGKQRLSTVLDFMAGKIGFEWNGEQYYYADLDEIMQGVIRRFCFNVTYAINYKAKPITDAQKIEWFRCVNFLGTPQEKTHLNNLLK